MKVTIVSTTDNKGGAAKAALRLLQSLRVSSFDAEMLVLQKNTDYFYVNSPKTRIEKALIILRNIIANKIQCLQKTNNKAFHSGNWFGSTLFKKLNTSDTDVVNLHWCNSEALSIKQIAKIRHPKLMTLHDMWAFCGSEHLVDDCDIARFREGYTKYNRFEGESGLDIDKIVWSRKKKYWTKPFQLVCPSTWLTDCTASSELFRGWPVSTIPNSLNTEIFKPLNKRFCRDLLNLPQDIPIIGFGAINGTNDLVKGFDLLLEALSYLNDVEALNDMACVVVGQSQPKEEHDLKRSVYYMGHLNDELSMALFYNAIDLMVVPSRQESFCQVASESQGCGTPVVAFNCTGIVDVVAHGHTGYLAKSYEPEDLANGIKEVLSNKDSYLQMQKNARIRAIKLWSQEVISKQYINLYQKVLNDLY